MDIKVTKTRRGDTIFVFRFEDEEDRDFWIDTWLECANRAGKGIKDYNPACLKYMVSTLKNRTDDKYATDSYKFSGMLFENEFVNFANETAYLMCIFNKLLGESTVLINRYENACDRYETVCDGYKNLCDKYDKLCDDKDVKYGSLCNEYEELCNKWKRLFDDIMTDSNDTEELDVKTDDKIDKDTSDDSEASVELVEISAKINKKVDDVMKELAAEYNVPYSDVVRLSIDGHLEEYLKQVDVDTVQSKKDDEYVNLCLQLGEDFTKLPRAEFIAKYQNEPEEGQTDDEIEIPDDLDWMKEIEVDESALNSTSVDDSEDNLDWMEEIEIHDDSLSE